MALLEVRGLTRRFGGLRAIDNVSFSVDEGEVFGLIGPNGAGKTTCFNLISGFLQPSSGHIFFRDQDITGRKGHEVARLGLVRTFQQTNVFANRTVLQNVVTGGYLRAQGSLVRALLATRDYRQAEAELAEEAAEVCRLVGLEPRLNDVADGLPYGDLRKLGIAIALASRPKLLLLDEPAAGLNPKESAELTVLIGRIRASGTTVLLVEHDMKVVMGISDRILVLNQGGFLATGTPTEIRSNPEVIRVYLGGARTRAAQGVTHA